MDNRCHEETSWDPGCSPRSLPRWSAWRSTRRSPASSAEELAALLAATPAGTLGLCDPDELVEPPRRPVTKPGDIWSWAATACCCGDATDAEDVARLMAASGPCCMATDRPTASATTAATTPRPGPATAGAISSADKTKPWDDYHDAAACGGFYASFLEGRPRGSP